MNMLAYIMHVNIMHTHNDLTYYVTHAISAEDGCDEQIQDTEYVQKAWINNLMENGYCDCDQVWHRDIAFVMCVRMCVYVCVCACVCICACVWCMCVCV